MGSELVCVHTVVARTGTNIVCLLWLMLYVFFVSSRFTPVFFNKYKLAAPRKAFFLPAFVARILTPQSRKSGYERLLGCTSGLDGGPDQKTFYDDFEPKHQGNFHGLFGCIRSGVVELVGREP